MPSILDGLNPEQREAAGHLDGPLLIIAGAGSGKTRTLTHRIAYLIGEQQVPPDRILAVTFTNKAAAEMKERVEKLVGDAARRMWIGTFHSLCARLLRENAARIGYKSSFAIYDEDDRGSLIKRVLVELNYDLQRFPVKHMAWRIGDWKNDLLTPEAASKTLGQFAAPPDKVAIEVYRRYQEQLKINNALDFDDLIGQTVGLLEQDEELRQRLSRRFQQIMVDEYQDINAAQYRFVQLLSSEHHNLCVVGDDDQSIYGWRGARIEIILRFDEDYPNAKVVKLERNYRSTQAVLDVANALIANNKGRRDKTLRTANPRGEPVTLHVAGNEHDEAWYVADQIAAGVRQGRRFGEHAVLYRTNAMSRVFEQVFSTKQIPYRMIGGVRFYDRKEIRDAIAYLRVLHNPSDDISLLRIINVPARGIGERTIQVLSEFAGRERLSLVEALPLASEDPDLLASGARARVKAFAGLLESLQSQVEGATVSELIETVLRESGYEAELLADGGIEASARLENLDELRSVAIETTTATGAEGLQEFLERVALVADTDSLAGDDAVVLMTLHSAKGLEFPVVLFVGLEEGLCPHSRSQESAEGIEEERRLCYVGMTRAAERLYLTCTWRRTIFGQTMTSKRSRFLSEVPADMLQGAEQAFAGAWDESPSAPRAGGNLDSMTNILSRKRRVVQAAPAGRSAASPAPTPEAREARPLPAAEGPTPFQAGQRVRHPKFGDGVVVNCTTGSGAEVQVAFPDQGVKKLLVEYANLEVV